MTADDIVIQIVFIYDVFAVMSLFQYPKVNHQTLAYTLAPGKDRYFQNRFL